MKKSCLIFISIFVLIFCANAQSQNRQLIGAAGSSKETDKFVISWTIGEAAADTSKSGLLAPLYFYQIEEDPGASALPKEDALQVDVFPTLVEQSFTVKIAQEELPVSLFIYTVDGKILLNRTLQNMETTIQLPNGSAALYILRIQNSNKQYSAKLIRK